MAQGSWQRRVTRPCWRSPLLPLAALAAAALTLAPQLGAAQLSRRYIIGPRSYLDVAQPPPGSSSLSPATVAAGAGANATAPAGLTPPEQQQLVSRRLLDHTPRHEKPYNVCLSNWAPMVRCSPDAAPDTYEGYQVELFRLLAADLGWEEGPDWAFTCLEYSAMMDDLLDQGGACSMSATGVEVFPEYLAAGLQFTWPTYRSGLRVMIHAQLQSGSTWAFSQVFHWTVWLTLGVTAAGVGLATAALEWATYGIPARDKPVQAWAWFSAARMVHVVTHVGDPGSDASRILVLGYGFLVLVMVSMYTAVSASRITAQRLVHPVHGKADLPGRQVATWERYVAPLQEHHGIAAAGQRWEGEADLASMVAGLRAGAAEALVLDAPVLEYTAGSNEACDLFLVGEPFESFSLALAFPPDFNASTVFAFSESIVRLQTFQGALDMLENVYIKTGGTDKCFGSDSGGHGSGESIQLRQVSGLWYILAMAIGACLVLTVAYNIRKDPRKMRVLRASMRRSLQAVRIGGSQPGSSVHSAGRAPTAAGASSDGAKSRRLREFLGVTASAYGDASSGDETQSPKQRRDHGRSSLGGGL